VRCRIHGDLRLARVLVAQSELVFIDAGGPAHRPGAERRAKLPPLADLGTLICSLHATVADVQQRMHVEHPELYPRLIEPLAQWLREGVARLLTAHAAISNGSPMLPADARQRAEIGRVFALGAASDALEAQLRAEPQGPPALLAGRLTALLSLLEDASGPVR
jgi:predicted trehalose synthase